jgi:hypothetical protein
MKESNFFNFKLFIVFGSIIFSIKKCLFKVGGFLNQYSFTMNPFDIVSPIIDRHFLELNMISHQSPRGGRSISETSFKQLPEQVNPLLNRRLNPNPILVRILE